MGKIQVTERVTGHTELIGLLAYPIRHTMSPTMHNEALNKLGLDYVYVALEVEGDSLENAVQGLRAMRFRGCNVSMPNKQRIIQYLDKVSEEVNLTKAVNTVVNDNGILTGYCTDGTGCMCSLADEGVVVNGAKVTIIGTGGAGTAIIAQAALDGVKELSIFNRRDEFWDKAVETVERINEKTGCKATLFHLEDQDMLREEIASSTVLINATGVGMKPLEGQALITDPSMLHSDLVVHDCIYSPRETRLMQVAEEAGCRKVMNGLGMMLYQGAAAFKLFTGHDMPIDFMKDVLF